jgi:hypothetical protein
MNMSTVTSIQETANVRVLIDSEVERVNGGVWQFVAAYVGEKLLDYLIGDHIHNPDTGPGPVPGGAWSSSRLY